MPIYDYLCESCGFQQDVLQKMSDPRLTDCPQCHQPTLKKQLTAAGFQLKGSGWYVTDFRDNNKKPSTPAGDAAKPAAAEGDSTPTSTDNGAPSATPASQTGALATPATTPAATPKAAPVTPATTSPSPAPAAK